MHTVLPVCKVCKLMYFLLYLLQYMQNIGSEECANLQTDLTIKDRATN